VIGASRRQKRIFHFFEDHGFSSLAAVQNKAKEQFPELDEDEALERFYREELDRYREVSAQQREEYYKNNPEELDSALKGQYLYR